MAKKSAQKPNIIERPPVIVVMGHIDHGKSTLLDYIRQSNVVDSEAGGITQHISAYEVLHKSQEHGEKRITFLDTPGHEAFGAMRSRGAKVADIAILVIAADDGVKTQTKEALQAIKESGIPYIVAINKIDKPEAHVQKAITSLIENEIYIEGYGGDIPYVQTSAKTGVGIDDLLDTILLVAELEELTGDTSKKAEGIVIETNIDPKKGISASLLVLDGSISSGMHIVSGTSSAPVRIMEDFKGSSIKEAVFSSPIRITGFDNVPTVGDEFITFDNKKEAKAHIESIPEDSEDTSSSRIHENSDKFKVPVIIKADVQGTIDAIKHEIDKLCTEQVDVRVVQSGIGSINENDILMAANNDHALVVGFNTSIPGAIRELAERQEVTVNTFSIIYELAKWISEKVEEFRPRLEVKDTLGMAKVLKTFSKQKDKQVIGARVKEGEFTKGAQFVIMRNDHELGEGKIIGLQQQKLATDRVTEGECGLEVESKTEIAPGDKLESFVITKK